MNVKEIVREHLEENGYDGLFHDECGCKIGDLLPCKSNCDDCEPGFIQDCSKCNYFDTEALACSDDYRECIGPKEMKMIKVSCDICGKEAPNKQHYCDNFRQDLNSEITIKFIMPTTMHVCKYCIIEMVKAHDDRSLPKPTDQRTAKAENV